jgi:glycine cleavage system regulatory protein
MNTPIVLTIIADDQPGIIETVSKVLTKHDGNWTQSSMSSLAGHFAGILLASVPDDKTEACLAELHELESSGLRIIANVSGEEAGTRKTSEYTLELVGNDHPGIVHEITRILASHKASVISLETSVEAASMGGGELFKARVQLLVPESSDIFALESELEDIANDLMVDICFEK